MYYLGGIILIAFAGLVTAGDLEVDLFILNILTQGVQ